MTYAMWALVTMNFLLILLGIGMDLFSGYSEHLPPRE